MMLYFNESPKKMQKIFTSVVEGVSSWSGIKLSNSAAVGKASKSYIIA